MDHKKFNKLLKKFHQNSLTDDERILFLLYLHREEFAEKRDLWLDQLWDENTLIQDFPNEDEILHKIIEKKQRKNYWRLFPYAAAAILILSLGTYYLTIKSQNASNANSAVVIMAGGNKAQLEYADGQKVDLANDQSTLIMGENGAYYNNGTTIRQDEGVKMATLRTPRAGQYQIVLSDGTRVYLNASSALTYPTYFEGDTRKVQLDGEAYFEVAKDAKRPFIVNTKTQEIKVLGTRFNVNAYQDEPISKTTLVEGSVAIFADGSKNVILKPNQQASLKDNTITVSTVDASEYISWTKGEIVLTNLHLPEVLNQLERWYDVTFEYSSLDLSGKTVFGVLDRTLPLEDILKSLEKSYQIKFKREGRRLSIEID